MRIVLYYPNYIYGARGSGSRDQGLKIGVMTLASRERSLDVSYPSHGALTLLGKGIDLFPCILYSWIV